MKGFGMDCRVPRARKENIKSEHLLCQIQLMRSLLLREKWTKNLLVDVHQKWLQLTTLPYLGWLSRLKSPLKK
uniref:Uncharacterized protein n=1 Tax=Brassica oleracea TaxID=3712 RepID=A0A3P6DDE9_BRAOL|nr:unnamed protein product [Brassica oleracea]